MRGIRALVFIGCCAALVGCSEKTYTVKFVNNYYLPSDFRVNEAGSFLDAYVDDLAGNGGTVTITHDGRAREVTIESGVHSGNEMVFIDSICTVRVSAGDVVTVEKTTTGELECQVAPELTASVLDQVGRRVLSAIGGR